MMENPIPPSASDTSLPHLATASSVVLPQVSNISSQIPLDYQRRVRFSDSIKSVVSPDSLRHVQASVDDMEVVSRKNKRSRPLAHIEPLSVSSLPRIQGTVAQKSESSAPSTLTTAYSPTVRPRIEIRLQRRPVSLYNVEGEAASITIDRIMEEGDCSNSSPRPSPSSRRLNKWLFPRKLTRFASSPSLVQCAEDKKVKTGVVDPQARPRADSESSSNNTDSPSETRKGSSEFFSIFKKKKSKTSTVKRKSGKTLHVEVFKSKDGEQNKCQSQNGKESTEDIELNSLDAEGDDTRSAAAKDNSDTTNVDTKSENLSSAFSYSNSNSSDHSISRARAHLLYNFVSQSPTPNESDKPFALIKDATNVHALKDGDVLVTDILSNKMVLFDCHGMPTVSFTLEQASEPWASCVTSDGTLAVTLRHQGCVSLWTLTGVSLSEFGHGVLIAPTGIQVDDLDRFTVTDEKSNTVSMFNKQGEFILTFIQAQTSPNASLPNTLPGHFRFNQPRYVCVTKDGLYVIADSASHCLRVFDNAGNFTNRIGSFGQKDGYFRFPYGVACDDNGLIYVADHFNHRVSVFTIQGEFQYHVISPQDGITRPKGLAIHNSLLYVSYGSLRAGRVCVFSIVGRQSA